MKYKCLKWNCDVLGDICCYGCKHERKEACACSCKDCAREGVLECPYSIVREDDQTDNKRDDMICVTSEGDISKHISEALHDVSHLVGCVSMYSDDDDIGVNAGNFDKYLLVGYIAQLLERGEIIITIDNRRLPYMLKLLHLDEKEK